MTINKIHRAASTSANKFANTRSGVSMSLSAASSWFAWWVELYPAPAAPVSACVAFDAGKHAENTGSNVNSVWYQTLPEGHASSSPPEGGVGGGGGGAGRGRRRRGGGRGFARKRRRPSPRRSRRDDPEGDPPARGRDVAASETSPPSTRVASTETAAASSSSSNASSSSSSNASSSPEKTPGRLALQSVANDAAADNMALLLPAACSRPHGNSRVLRHLLVHAHPLVRSGTPVHALPDLPPLSRFRTRRVRMPEERPRLPARARAAQAARVVDEVGEVLGFAVARAVDADDEGGEAQDAGDVVPDPVALAPRVGVRADEVGVVGEGFEVRRSPDP